MIGGYLVAWLLGASLGVGVGFLLAVSPINRVAAKIPSYKREKELVNAERKRKATRMLADGLPADYVIATCSVSKAEVEEILRS